MQGIIQRRDQRRISTWYQNLRVLSAHGKRDSLTGGFGRSHTPSSRDDDLRRQLRVFGGYIQGRRSGAPRLWRLPHGVLLTGGRGFAHPEGLPGLHQRQLGLHSVGARLGEVLRERQRRAGEDGERLRRNTFVCDFRQGIFFLASLAVYGKACRGACCFTWL